MTSKLSTDQKIDLILEKVTGLEKNQSDLIKTVGEVALLAGKTADNIDDLSKVVSGIKKEASDISDEQDIQGKKLDQLSGSGSFTPFRSGAFVA